MKSHKKYNFVGFQFCGPFFWLRLARVGGIYFHKTFGGVIDRLAWRSMHFIARRQEKRIRPYFSEELNGLPADPALLFPAPLPPALAGIKTTRWEKRGARWQRDLSFPSAWPSSHFENNTAYVRAFAGAPEARRPAIIMLHGLMNVTLAAYRPFIKAVMENGAAAYALEMPYHHRRTPLGSISGDLFHTANLEMTFHAVQQAVSDVRRLLQILRQDGAPRVGILGFSLGAWIGGLLACCEPELDCAFLGMPPHDLNHLVWHSGLGAQLRRCFAAQGWNENFTAAFYDKLDPLSYRPLLLPEHLQLYAAAFDSLIPLERVQALRRAWSSPPLRIYPHGHLTIMISRQMHRDFREDLRNQLARRKMSFCNKGS